MTAITKFTINGDHTFLSNFYPSPISQQDDDGVIVYPTVEHYFAAQKTTSWSERVSISAASTPGQAKRLGRRVELRPDWEAIKYDVMRVGINAKFYPGTELADRLLKTEDAYLVEGNYWGDKTWGQVAGEGSNWLGIILMARRAELKHLYESTLADEV